MALDLTPRWFDLLVLHHHDVRLFKRTSLDAGFPLLAVKLCKKHKMCHLEKHEMVILAALKNKIKFSGMLLDYQFHSTTH